jgi:hypothetical protein
MPTLALCVCVCVCAENGGWTSHGLLFGRTYDVWWIDVGFAVFLAGSRYLDITLLGLDHLSRGLQLWPGNAAGLLGSISRFVVSIGKGFAAI